MKLDKTITVKLDSETLSAIDSFAQAEGVGRSEAVRALVVRALNQGTLTDEIAEKVADPIAETIAKQTERLEELEDRLAKVSARGTKAALATLVATATYMAPIGNVARANHNLIALALEREGLSVPPQNIDYDLAALCEWEGLGADELFAFSWEAGGRIQRTGTKATYAAAVKGIRKPSPRAAGYSHQELVEHPELRGVAWFDAHFDEGFFDEWIEMVDLKHGRDRIRAEAERGERYISPLEEDNLAREERAYRNTRAMLVEAAEDTMDPFYNRLVFDPEVPPFWREPTDEEKEERARKLIGDFGDFGFKFVD